MECRYRQSSPTRISGPFLLWACLVVFSLSGVCLGDPQGTDQNSQQIQQAVGTIRSIDDAGITLSTDAGEVVHVTLQDSARLLRVTPGQKDLKGATPLRKQDLQAGDRILVRGRQSPDTHALTAVAVIVMKQSDVEAKQEKDREDWQKRGVGGLVSAIDPASSTITISMTSFTGSKTVAVHLAPVRGEFCEVRRCQDCSARADQSGGSAARARSQERGRKRAGCGGSRLRNLPQSCRHDHRR
jgi:hypothetical protein